MTNGEIHYLETAVLSAMAMAKFPKANQAMVQATAMVSDVRLRAEIVSNGKVSSCCAHPWPGS